MKAVTRHMRVSIVVALLIGAGIFLPRVGASPEATRDIRIVARGMAYQIEGIAGPNPALPLLAGEQVRVIFRNEDKGMLHDFGIPDWNVGTGIVQWGSEKTITFRVPAGGASAAYVCSPHSAMMSGRIIISK